MTQGLEGERRHGGMLAWAGVGSFLVAVFQAVISFSPAWSLYFGAPPEMAAKPALLAAAGLLVAALLAMWGLYGLSGAGKIRPLPLLRPVLLGAGIVYALRGLGAAPQAAALLLGWWPGCGATAQGLASSLVSLALGLLYLAGVRGAWRDLCERKRT